MPDIPIVPETTLLEHAKEKTVSDPIPERKILAAILEDISLEFVLADISDPATFSELLALLKHFFQAANQLNLSELAEDAKKAGKIVKKIMEQREPDHPSAGNAESSSLNFSGCISDTETLMDSLHLRISEMKSFLDFLTRSSELSIQKGAATPSAPDLQMVSTTIERVHDLNKSDYGYDLIEIEPEQNTTRETGSEESVKTDSESRREPEVSTTCILHPGKLPPFLNIEDFAEFLSLQKKSLESMEVLILDIERENNIAYAQGELKRLFHTTKGEAGFLGLKDVEKVCHRAEDLMDRENFGNIVDLLLAVKDWLESTYSLYAGNPGVAPSAEKIIAMFDGEQKPCQNQRKPDSEASVASIHPPSIMAELINVDASRLDRLVNIIGELAIAESMVTQAPEIISIASSALLRSLGSLHKITRELQTLGLTLRMVPLKSLFNRMERVVRDLARKTGKQIQFIVKGESTELDKTIVDRLGDPLIHLLRNSVDHGIEESIHQRVNGGKPETATIELRAFHKGGNLFIEVEDDGRGINRTKLKEKAICQGIIDADTPEDGEELLNLAFHPGVTTANKITDVSGRGVGMDVVKKSIESCRGKVSISSAEGRGTTFSIRIPLTLSIIDGLVVRVSEERYVIPTLSVVTSLKVDKRQISNLFEKREMVSVIGKLIPLLRLNRLFQLSGGVEDTCDGIIVVVEDSGLKVALLVDELMGKQNTVIKKLGTGMDNIRGISGGTIMADGRVSLILDIAGIVELSRISYRP